MRKDIYEGVLPFIMTHTKPNYAALAKQYNCDYRTVKRYYEAEIAENLNKTSVDRKESFFEKYFIYIIGLLSILFIVFALLMLNRYFKINS